MKKKLFLLLAFTFLCAVPFRVHAMQIFVKLSDNVKYNLEVEPSTTIEDIKYRIYDKEPIPRDSQVLTYNNIVLEDNRTLADYNIQKEYEINLDVQGIVVEGISLTSQNPSNPDNTAIYNDADKSLTLNKYNGDSIKYYGEDKLNIILKDNNSIVIANEYYDYGIYSIAGDIKFSGNGSLKIVDSIGGIFSNKNVEIDNANIVIENALAGGIITYGKTIINGNLDVQSFVFPIMTENDVVINGGNIELKSDTMGIFVTGSGSLYINGGNINILSGEKDNGAAIVVLKNEDGQGIFVDDNMYVVQDGISLQNASIEFNSDNYVGFTYGNDDGNIIIYEMMVESVNVAHELTIKAKEKEYSYKFMSIDTFKFTEGNIDKLEIQIDGDFKLYDSLKISDLKLEKDIDYVVSEGSTIINFTDNGIAKLNTLKKGEYEIKAKYSNDKEAIGKLIINELDNNEENPDTGDNMLSYLIIGSLSLTSLIGGSLYINRKRFN